jgi:RimJ/RimL family protein N-acetyltransferase
MAKVSVRLEPWSTTDGRLMARLLGDPVMTVHLGGPESPQKLADRQARYEKPDSRQYKIVVGEPGEGVGAVGYWEREDRGNTIWEVGWLVVPEEQGKGYASAGMRMLLELMRADDVRHQSVHAYPAVDNAASNAICRKLGFTLRGSFDAEYPPGNPVKLNDWQYDLFPKAA